MYENPPQSEPKSPAERLQEVGAEKGVRIEEGADAPELHADIQAQGFEALPNAEAFLKRIGTWLQQEFLPSPIIRDSFESHLDRVEWRNGLPQELKVLYKKNKLGANKAQSARTTIDMLVRQIDQYDIHTPEAERVRELYDKLPSEEELSHYLELSNDEREAIIRDLDRIAREFLRVITKKEV